MNVTILYFASLREAVGTHRETLALPQGVTSAGQLRDWLATRGGAWAQSLAPGRAVRVAVNQVMGAADTTLADGAEVAFFPPVTGG